MKKTGRNPEDEKSYGKQSSRTETGQKGAERRGEQENKGKTYTGGDKTEVGRKSSESGFQQKGQKSAGQASTYNQPGKGNVESGRNEGTQSRDQDEQSHRGPKR